MDPTSQDREEHALLLPEGTRLLHIGPPKTATTALQGAFHAARRELRSQGVRYAGRGRHPAQGVAAVIGRAHLPAASSAPPISRWQALVREITTATEPRVVVSSEYFAGATPAMIRRVAGDLGAERLQIAVTLRPLARILPSSWQQAVQRGHSTTFDDWLHEVFDTAGQPPLQGFWFRHRHDALIARWAEVVGVDRLTVIVLDDRDRGRVLRVFEGLLGLRSATLDAPEGPSNRSLTLSEAEAVRAFNAECEARRISKEVALSVMLQGAVPFLKELEPEPGSARIELPDWAIDATATASREIVDGIAAAGVRVLGDLETLTWVPAGGDGAPAAPVAVSPRLAAMLTMGALIGGGVAPDSARVAAGRATRSGSASSSARAAAEGAEAGLADVTGAASGGQVGSERARLGRNRTRLLAGALAREVRETAARRVRAGIRRGRKAIRVRRRGPRPR